MAARTTSRPRWAVIAAIGIFVIAAGGVALIASGFARDPSSAATIYTIGWFVIAAGAVIAAVGLGIRLLRVRS